MRFDGFIGPSYQSESLSVDAEDTLNLYVEVAEQGQGKTPKALYGTPGTNLFTTLPETPGRGLWPGDKRLFAAAGSGLYEVFADGSYNRRGDIGNDNLPVQIVPNGDQLGISSNGKFYCDNGTGPANPVFTEDSTPVPARQVAYLDGYFIAQDTPGYADPSPAVSGKAFFLSALLDGTTWSNLEFASKEGYPDNLAAILADHEQLYLFGDEQSSEVWQDTGAANFPFQRDPGAMMHFGCSASFAVVRLDQGVAWIGIDEARGGPIALYAQGFIPQRVSTHAIETAWGSYPKVSDAVAYSYIENGHHFWVINFPTANKSWCYDRSTGFWHRRGWWNGASSDRQRVAFHAYVGIGSHSPQHYGQDWQNGNIYTVSTEYYNDNGTSIQRQRTAPHLTNEELETYYRDLVLDTEVLDPSMTKESSNDGGHTFGTARTPSSVNSTVDTYRKRTIWRRNGHARTRTERITSFAAIKHAWIGAYINTAAGSM